LLAGPRFRGTAAAVQPTGKGQRDRIRVAWFTEEQAKELLAIAEKDCTGAISAIKTGIRVGDEAI